MIELPPGLLATIPASSLTVARDWWSTLRDEDRRQIVDLWDNRREVHFFEPQADDDGRADAWGQTPKVRGGRFLPPDDAWGLDDWGPGYFEHLLQHPELVLMWEPERRTFHIGCTLHAEAKACQIAGRVPEAFLCPVGSSACPLISLRGARLSRVQASS